MEVSVSGVPGMEPEKDAFERNDWRERARVRVRGRLGDVRG